MLRAGGTTSSGDPLVLAGLSEDNISRLKAGRPIKAPLVTFGVELPGTLVIMYGLTEDAIIAELKAQGEVSDHVQATADAELDQYRAVMRDHEHILVATVGLPRSGKTTWARSQSYPIVNPDSIRLELHGQAFRPETERHVWAIAHTMVGCLFRAGHKVVILDATNTTRNRRDEWKDSRWGLFFKYIDTPAKMCLDRAINGGRDDLIPVIVRMDNSLELLGPDESRWIWTARGPEP